MPRIPLDALECRLSAPGFITTPKGSPDLVLTLWRTGDTWWPQVIATGLNALLHHGRITAQRKVDGQDVLEIDCPLGSDPWIPGGPLHLILNVGVNGTVVDGTIAGTWRGQAVSGSISGSMRSRRFQASAATPEVPPVLDAWRRAPAQARLPDFTDAGYRNGREPIPTPIGPMFRVEDFGAVADSGRDATAAIQAAIDAAVAGGGGVVLFPPGRFEIGLLDPDLCLFVHGPGVVLRGAGSGLHGTELFAHHPGQSPFPDKKWLSGIYPRHIRVQAWKRAGAMDADLAAPERIGGVASARRGERRLTMFDAGLLEVGQIVQLVYQDDDADSLAHALATPSTRLGSAYHGPHLRHYQQLLRITAIDDDVVEVDAPVRLDAETRWRPGLWTPGPRIHGCGIEGLRLTSAWEDAFVHHQDDLHDNGWDCIKLIGADDCWVRDVVCDSCTTAIGLGDCRACTIQDCRIVGNPGHNGFGVHGCSTGNLILRCDAARQMHAFAMNGTASGNVFCECSGHDPSGIDLHGSLSIANCFDHCHGLVLTGGGSPAALPPRHGRELVLWNCRLGSLNPYKPHRTLATAGDAISYPGLIAVGVHARGHAELTWHDAAGHHHTADRDDAWAHLWAINRAVRPGSLWRAQLAARFGAVPGHLGQP